MVAIGAAVGILLTVHHGAPPAPPASTTTTSAAAAGPECPLTGLPAPGGTVPARPALAIKVDNYPAARPQSGLDKADIVFEEPVEGGITRLVAVFQCSGASLVGPIRSARAVDVQILDQLSHPLFVHAGGIGPVISMLQAGNLTDDNVFWHGSIIVNPPGRVAPYDTYVTTGRAWALQPSDTTPPQPLFTYATEVPTGTPAAVVHVPYSSTNDNDWSWDSGSRTWQLTIGGTPATSADGNRIGVANVVIESVQVSYGPWLENDQGGLEVQSHLTGSGPLVVLRDGVEITGTWQRGALSSPTSLVAADGTSIPLAPGPTWVEIVPSTIRVTASH
ncbi:MAG TPA: DUF3048 domain-containing protein [Acidimicrobiales bacterium]|nr:DUF3048 domain-containing protein [Acidimicrobiales bacterium]